MTAASNSESRKRWAVVTPDPECAHPCLNCPHGIKWHHDDRGCQYHGVGIGSCPCDLSADDVLAARIEQARAEGAADVVARVEALADDWAQETTLTSLEYADTLFNCAIDLRAALRGDA